MLPLLLALAGLTNPLILQPSSGIGCGSGQVSCSGSCSTLATDPNNCGACGTVCGGGQQCYTGSCTTYCLPTQVLCGGLCVNPLSDIYHCGAVLDCANSASTGLSLPNSVQVDTTNNNLIVGNYSTGSISVFPRTWNGTYTSSPTRTISGAATTLSKGTNSLYIDTVNNEIGSCNSIAPAIAIFARTANGNTAPLRNISGALTGLVTPEQIAVDTVNNEIVEGDLNGGGVGVVNVFSRTANGNIAPLRTITMGANSFLAGVYVDTFNNEIGVNDNGNNRIVVYSRTASGTATPLRTINLDVLAQGPYPYNLYVDTINNEVGLVSDPFPVNFSGQINIYPRTANGTIAPIRTIQGFASGLEGPQGITVDTVHDEIIVTDNGLDIDGNGLVSVFPRRSNGNVAPLRTISSINVGASCTGGNICKIVNFLPACAP